MTIAQALDIPACPHDAADIEAGLRRASVSAKAQAKSAHDEREEEFYRGLSIRYAALAKTVRRHSEGSKREVPMNRADAAEVEAGLRRASGNCMEACRKAERSAQAQYFGALATRYNALADVVAAAIAKSERPPEDAADAPAATE